MISKYLPAILLLFPMLAHGLTIESTDTSFSFGRYQITESAGSDPIYYTIVGGSTTDPITAFAVGFEGGVGENTANATLSGWNALTIAGSDWNSSNLSGIGSTAKAFFAGLSWTDFKDFDPASASIVDNAAIFYATDPSFGIASLTPVGGFSVSAALAATPTVIKTAGGGSGGGPANQPNSINSVPEPMTILLILAGLVGLRISRQSKPSRLHNVVTGR